MQTQVHTALPETALAPLRAIPVLAVKPRVGYQSRDQSGETTYGRLKVAVRVGAKTPVWGRYAPPVRAQRTPASAQTAY